MGRQNLVKLVLVLVGVVALVGFLPRGDADYLHERASQGSVDRLLELLAAEPSLATVDSAAVAILEGPRRVGPDTASPAIRQLIERALSEFAAEHAVPLLWEATPERRVPPLSLTFRQRRGATELVSLWRPAGAEPVRWQLSEPHYRSLALLPPLVAIVLALAFRQTLLALFAGVWLGASLVPWFQSAMTVQRGFEAAAAPIDGSSSWPNPLLGLWKFVNDYLWQRSLLDRFRLDIIGFVAILIAAVGVMTRGAGIAGLVEFIVRFAKTVRSTRLATALLGLVIFFDDYTNTIIVGNTMRPLTDRMRISREKLAYLVDSTAAPVAGIMVLSTWVAYEVSQFAPQLEALGIDQDPYAVFLQTVPYRYYCLFTLFFVFATTIWGRDFGPMWRAERRAQTRGEVLRPGAQPLVAARSTNLQQKPGAPPRAWNAALPLLMVLSGTLLTIVSGGAALVDGPIDWSSLEGWRQVLSNADTARALFVGSIAGWVTAVVLMVAQRILSVGECVGASVRGAAGVVMALCILLLAWAIGEVCADLGTAHVLIALFKGVISPYILPITLFLLACLVSFSTGSSWSTMAIILPNTVQLAFAIGESFPAGPMVLTLLSIGAVLEGSIFGDHCSPLSDTTILSSVASASDHVDHVRTQMPYALVTMLTAILLGYVPAVLGLPWAVSWVVGGAALVGLLAMIGKPTDGASSS